jgi:uncharacterized protein YcbK (DUF882 family)
MDRRSFPSLVAGCITWSSIAHAVSRPPIALRRLRLVNAHSGETFDGAYRDDKVRLKGSSMSSAFSSATHHSGQKTQIDVGVIDFLTDVLDAVGETKATILSAYRTAETNAMLARTTFGVAEHSQHVVGRARHSPRIEAFPCDDQPGRCSAAASAGIRIRVLFTSIPGRYATGPSTGAASTPS